MEKEMRGGNILISSLVILAILILMLLFLLLLLIILFIFAFKFKPWRRFTAPPRLRISSSKIAPADDIERPLVSADLFIDEIQSGGSTVSYSTEGADRQTQGDSIAVAPRQRILPTSHQLMHSDSFILDIPNTSEDSSFGQTLKRPSTSNHFAKEQIHEKREDINHTPRYGSDKNTFSYLVPTSSSSQRSILGLEVIAGPARGYRYSIHSTNTSKLPVTIGRVSPGDILLKDSEVSGKHAMISWNANKLKWELVDMGSLNGTLLNSLAVHHHQSGSRHWGNPFDLSTGDVITVGTSSKILVQITDQAACQIPLGIGVASDAMALRRGGKKFPMEDVCYYQWPISGTSQFGLFGICDGHGGADAATYVSKIMPEVIAGILSDSFRREKVLLQRDASDVLKEAFYQTETRISHYYEGCTATAFLVWADGNGSFYAQCANVGDSACLINFDGKQIKLTEDHRITSYTERARFQALGAPLRDGETRICGINLARMIGDKFLKEQDARFSPEPYISEVVYINQASKGFALLASDGFWDVVNTKKAVQLVQQTMEKNMMDGNNSAETIANVLLSEARTLRTKDNTSIIFLDFNTTNEVDSSQHHL